jgi:hypothetical protein
LDPTLHPADAMLDGATRIVSVNSDRRLRRKATADQATDLKANAQNILELLLRRAPNRSRLDATSHLPGVIYFAPRHPEDVFGANPVEEALASGEAPVKFFGCDYLGHGRGLTAKTMR